jgi:hypothetical protein
VETNIACEPTGPALKVLSPDLIMELCSDQLVKRTSLLLIVHNCSEAPQDFPLCIDLEVSYCLFGQVLYCFSDGNVPKHHFD